MATVWMTVTLLKCRRLHFLCTPYSVSISKVKNVHITVRGTLIGCILHPASAIVWPRLTTWSKIVALIQSYMHLYVLGLFLCLPLKPFTMHPYPSSSSWLLTLIIFWMFIHMYNVCITECITVRMYNSFVVSCLYMLSN